MKNIFTYEDRILVESLFDNEFEKVFLNLKARLKNAPAKVKDQVIVGKEKEIMRRFINKYMY